LGGRGPATLAFRRGRLGAGPVAGRLSRSRCQAWRSSLRFSCERLALSQPGSVPYVTIKRQIVTIGFIVSRPLLVRPCSTLARPAAERSDRHVGHGQGPDSIWSGASRGVSRRCDLRGRSRARGIVSPRRKLPRAAAWPPTTTPNQRAADIPAVDADVDSGELIAAQPPTGPSRMRDASHRSKVAGRAPAPSRRAANQGPSGRGQDAHHDRHEHVRRPHDHRDGQTCPRPQAGGDPWNSGQACVLAGVAIEALGA